MIRGAKNALIRHVCVGDKENKNIFNIVKVKHVNPEPLRAASHYGQRPLICTNQMTRKHVFGLLTLHTRGQNPEAVVLQNAYMTILFDQGDKLSKEV